MYIIEELKMYCLKCRKCRLSSTRTNVVFGEGNEHADIMFVGEGPGYYEDVQGKPFVGKAGQLLDKMIEAIKLKRSDVYITNVVKCRLPENRNPLDDECDSCLEYLRWQVKLINPKIIVCLGAVSAKNLINQDFKISKQRGQFVKKGNFYFMPTYHPSYLLRNELYKKDAWADFKNVASKLKQIQTVNLSPRDGKEIENIVKIKSRDAKVKDFKDKPIKIFIEKKNEENFTRSSIHGVKGETYDAVLLHVKNQTGNTITPAFLKNGAIDSELMRIAYVGMTRPRRLLVVAMPGIVAKDDFPRFPKGKWEYVELK